MASSVSSTALSSNITKGLFASYSLGKKTQTPVQSFAVVNEQIYSGHQDGTIRKWDSLGCFTFEAHKKEVTCLKAFGNLLYSISDDFLVKIWDPSATQCLQTIQIPKKYSEQKTVSGLAMTRTKVVIGLNDTILIWNQNSNEFTECPHRGRVWTVAEEKLYLAASHVSGIELINGELSVEKPAVSYRIECYDIDSWKAEKNFAGHAQMISAVFIDDGKLFTSSHDKTIKIWDLSSGKWLFTLDCCDFFQCLYVADGYVFASGSQIQIWDLNTVKCAQSFIANGSTPVAFLNGRIYWIEGNRIHVRDYKADHKKIFEQIAVLYEEFKDKEAEQRFLSLPQSTREKTYTKFYQIIKHRLVLGVSDYTGCAADAFHGKNGQWSASKEKALALRSINEE